MAELHSLKTQVERNAAEFHKLLRDAPWKQYDAGVERQHAAADKCDSTPRQPSPVAPAPKDSKKTQKSANSATPRRPFGKRVGRWIKRIFLKKDGLERLGIAAGILYAAVTLIQWRDLRHNFKVDQRAWIGITRIDASLDPDKPTNLLVHVSNSGKTPALNARSNHFVECIPNGSSPQFGESERNATARSDQVPGSERILTHVNICYNPKRVRDVLDGNLALYVYGTIWYEDIFGDTHKTTFCNFYDRIISQMNGCPWHNTSD